MKRLFMHGIVFAGLAFLLAGCGGGSRMISTATGIGASRGAGSVVFKVKWPPLSRLVPGRFIPAAAQSLQITFLDASTGKPITDSKISNPTIIARPNSSATINNLPAGIPLTVTVQALPNLDGTGVAQASGIAPSITIPANNNSNPLPIGLTMGTTVTTLNLLDQNGNAIGGSNNIPQVNASFGTPVTLSVAAKDKDGNTVLVAPTELVWTAQSAGSGYTPGVVFLQAPSPGKSLSPQVSVSQITGTRVVAVAIGGTSSSGVVQNASFTIVESPFGPASSPQPQVQVNVSFQTETAVDLTPGTSYSSSVANGINQNGVVVGTLTPASTGANDAFIWTPNAPNLTTGTLTDLQTSGTFPNGTTDSRGRGININNVVVGWYSTTNPKQPSAYVYDSVKKLFFTLPPLSWSNPSITDDSAEALAINDSNVVVGQSWDSTSRLKTKHGVQWQWNGSTWTATYLPTLLNAAQYAMTANPDSHALSINNAGLVAGESVYTTAAAPTATLWTTDFMPHNLGSVPGSLASHANGINNQGEVVGEVDGLGISVDGSYVHRGGWWIPGKALYQLAALGSDASNLNSFGNAINASHNIVGDANNDEFLGKNGKAQENAALWLTGVFAPAPPPGVTGGGIRGIDLGEVVPASTPIVPSRANDINDKNQIVGQGFDRADASSGSYQHAFLMNYQ